MILACHRPFKQSPVYANSITCSESAQEWETVMSLVNEVILQSSEFGVENNALTPLSFQNTGEIFSEIWLQSEYSLYCGILNRLG